MLRIDVSVILLSGQIAAWVIKSSEETMLSNSVCDSNHFPLFCVHKSLNEPLVVRKTNADFEWLGWLGPSTGAWEASYR